jgi:hypothetical protein
LGKRNKKKKKQGMKFGELGMISYFLGRVRRGVSGSLICVKVFHGPINGSP